MPVTPLESVEGRAGGAVAAEPLPLAVKPPLAAKPPAATGNAAAAAEPPLPAVLPEWPMETKERRGQGREAEW